MQVTDYASPQSVACPRKTCNALPGEPCVDRSGRVRPRPHTQRGRVNPPKYGGPTPSVQHWLMPSCHGECPNCGQNMAYLPSVYRKTPPDALCRTCADDQGVPYRPSKPWRELYGSDPYGDR